MVKMRHYISNGPNFKKQQPSGDIARANGRYHPSRKRKVEQGKPVGTKNCRR